MFISGNAVLVTEYIGIKRFDQRTVYSFSRCGSVWFAKKRHGNTVVIDEVK